MTIPRLTEAEYLALDRANPLRSEYIGGEMFAMAGGTLRHAALAARCIAELFTGPFISLIEILVKPHFMRSHKTNRQNIRYASV